MVCILGRGYLLVQTFATLLSLVKNALGCGFASKFLQDFANATNSVFAHKIRFRCESTKNEKASLKTIQPPTQAPKTLRNYAV